MSAVLDEYLLARGADLKPGSHATLGHRLKAFLRVVDRDHLLSRVTPAVAAKLYATRVAETKPDTHRAELGAAAAMFSWCLKRGWIAANPFVDVDPTGRKSVRRAHLRIDEARRFLDACHSDLSDAGLACALALLFGLRASEVVGLRVRDIDDGARVLWVADAKTPSGVRHLEVPEQLRKRLARKIAKRPADEQLFGGMGRHWLSHHVERLCGLAEVPVIGPHALRRTWSALAAEALPVDAVATALGQRGAAVNKRHYQPSGSVERRSAARAQAAVAKRPESGNRKG